MTPVSRRRFIVGSSLLVTTLAGCAADVDDANDGVPASDEELSREDAARYALDYAESEWLDRDEEAHNLYQDGTAAIADENYSRAIRDLELSFEIYEELSEESFEKRNEFEEGQNRRELFTLAWDMYRLMHESVSAWYNAAYAIQVEDDPVGSVEWAEEAEVLRTGAREAATEYHNTIDAWLEGEDTLPEETDDGVAEPEMTDEEANEYFESWLEDIEADIFDAEHQLSQGFDAYDDEQFTEAELFFEEAEASFQALEDMASAEGLKHDSAYLIELFSLLTEYFSFLSEAANLFRDASLAWDRGNEMEAGEAEREGDELLIAAEEKALEIEDQVDAVTSE